MGGRHSRNKGARSERQLRDELRDHGWSGVSREGWKQVRAGQEESDDVIGTAPDGKAYAFENKARATGFDKILKLLPRDTTVIAVSLASGELLTLAVNPNLVILPDLQYLCESEFSEKHRKVFNSVAKKCRDWIGNAHILSLKQDRKPFIYVRYRK